MLPPDDRIVEYLLRLGDDRLVLGHRLSEWCGHAPIAEEDIALANIALDCLGHASLLLTEAGRLEGAGRDEDALVFWRDVTEYRNCLLVEQANTDFAVTMVRQFFIDVYADLLYASLRTSAWKPLADIATRVHREVAYHRRHSGEWILRLGDGTEESHARAQSAVDRLWRFTGELFRSDRVEQELAAAGVAPRGESLREPWYQQVDSQLHAATLRVPPEIPGIVSSGRDGRHTEALDNLLAVMQSLARAYPGARW